ncbi:hypothetical protein Taro_039719 [Colocasia esculenta]|uniref:Uncharacterized protein n=1 Tax=Colocasia esculenta TaxID=4460 RepID=A0A843WBC3_COLES|nr:hypothetical protein [Colocasia esculenta]
MLALLEANFLIHIHECVIYIISSERTKTSGAFKLGCVVYPVAIRQSFIMYLVQLMTSWAVVCDVWYLEPQFLKPGESPIEFVERVRDIISIRAGLKKVP